MKMLPFSFLKRLGGGLGLLSSPEDVSMAGRFCPAIGWSSVTAVDEAPCTTRVSVGSECFMFGDSNDGFLAKLAKSRGLVRSAGVGRTLMANEARDCRC